LIVEVTRDHGRVEGIRWSTRSDERDRARVSSKGVVEGRCDELFSENFSERAERSSYLDHEGNPAPR
jgi:hypothetical protein